jgi:hypothetical protein
MFTAAGPYVDGPIVRTATGFDKRGVEKVLDRALVDRRSTISDRTLAATLACLPSVNDFGRTLAATLVW